MYIVKIKLYKAILPALFTFNSMKYHPANIPYFHFYHCIISFLLTNNYCNT